MKKAKKSWKNVDIFTKMEDVFGKKALDFFGRIVHNGGYPLDRTNKCVAKHT